MDWNMIAKGLNRLVTFAHFIQHDRSCFRIWIDQSDSERKTRIGEILVDRIDPTVSDQDAFQRSSNDVCIQDSLSQVGNVLTSKALSTDIEVHLAILREDFEESGEEIHQVVRARIEFVHVV